jgi:hypothetical protein
MLMLDEEEDNVKTYSTHENITDKVEWVMCDYLQCFHVFIFCNCYKNNKNSNESVAISQTASDIILHQSEPNNHLLPRFSV